MQKIRYAKEKIGISVAYIAVVAVFAAFHWPCVFQFLFHVPCPGCGMTRAVLALLRGEFSAAFEYHAMVWSLPLLYIYFWCDGALFRKKWLDRSVLLGIAAGFLAVWVQKIAEIMAK